MLIFAKNWQLIRLATILVKNSIPGKCVGTGFFFSGPLKGSLMGHGEARIGSTKRVRTFDAPSSQLPPILACVIGVALQSDAV